MKNRIRQFLLLIVPAAFSGISLCTSAPVSAAELHLALADSTCGVMHEVGDVFTKRTGITLSYTCKSSGLLAKGIQAGIIRADFFLSASKKWMESVVAAGLVDAKDVQNHWANELIVAGRADDTSLNLESPNDLTAPQVKQIIIGDPSNAPFGRYAKQAMVQMGVWQEVRGKITTRKNISLVIESVKNETDGTVCIIFRTGLDPALRLLAAIPRQMSDPANYYAAPLQKAAAQEEIARFLTFLAGSEALAIFRAAGFVVLPDKS